LTQSKKQQQDSIAIVFRFAVAGFFCFKWGSRPKPWAVLCAVYLASGCAYSSGKGAMCAARRNQPMMLNITRDC